jgi:hypothetical protein
MVIKSAFIQLIKSPRGFMQRGYAATMKLVRYAHTT